MPTPLLYAYFDSIESAHAAATIIDTVYDCSPPTESVPLDDRRYLVIVSQPKDAELVTEPHKTEMLEQAVNVIEQHGGRARTKRLVRLAEGPVTWSLQTIDPATLEINIEREVGLPQRTGVYCHSWKCQECSLEYLTFSWVADRHTARSTYCPECGLRGAKTHWVSTISEDASFDGSGSGREIYSFVPFPDAVFMDDSEFLSVPRRN
jgi:hypothetical protein